MFKIHIKYENMYEVKILVVIEIYIDIYQPLNAHLALKHK